MSISSIRPNCPRLRPLGSRKRHYEPAVQSVSANGTVTTMMSTSVAAAVAKRENNICGTRFTKNVRLLVPIIVFAAIYLYGMFDQAESSPLTNFENSVFLFLAPAMIFSMGLINVYGLWKSRRTTARKAHHN